jgi:hypothetical protein
VAAGGRETKPANLAQSPRPAWLAVRPHPHDPSVARNQVNVLDVGPRDADSTHGVYKLYVVIVKYHTYQCQPQEEDSYCTQASKAEDKLAGAGTRVGGEQYR